jgi:hypothetical protein
MDVPTISLHSLAFGSKKAKQIACYSSNVGNFNIVLIYEIQKPLYM